MISRKGERTASGISTRRSQGGRLRHETFTWSRDLDVSRGQCGFPIFLVICPWDITANRQGYRVSLWIRNRAHYEIMNKKDVQDRTYQGQFTLGWTLNGRKRIVREQKKNMYDIRQTGQEKRTIAKCKGGFTGFTPAVLSLVVVLGVKFSVTFYTFLY